jgi:hypothetical protein
LEEGAVAAASGPAKSDEPVEKDAVSKSIYDIATEKFLSIMNAGGNPFVGGKGKEFLDLLKKAVSSDEPVTADNFRKINNLTAFLMKFQAYNSVEAMCRKVLAVIPKDCQAWELMLTAYIAQKYEPGVLSVCKALLTADYRAYVEYLKPSMKSSLLEVKNSIKDLAGVYSSAAGFLNHMKFPEEAMKASAIAYEISSIQFQQNGPII